MAHSALLTPLPVSNPSISFSSRLTQPCMASHVFRQVISCLGNCHLPILDPGIPILFLLLSGSPNMPILPFLPHFLFQIHEYPFHPG